MTEPIAERREDRAKTTATKTTQAAQEAGKFLKKYYAAANQAHEQGKKTAWVMVGCMTEQLLKAMDIVPVFTENYGAVCAAKKVATQFLDTAETEGYSNLICGYARTVMGYSIRRSREGRIPPEAPWGGIPDPDMLIGSSYSCDPRYKWYQATKHYLDVPYCTFDVQTPPVDADFKSVEGYYVEYWVAGLRRLKDFLEKHTGKKLNEDRLLECIQISEKTAITWWQCYQLRKLTPGPMPSEDMFSCMIPGYYDRADEESLHFYERLLAELKNRVASGLGVVPNEKHRLLWAAGIPPWHAMNIFNYLEGLGAVSVMDIPYYQGDPYWEAEKIADPLERIARWNWYRLTQRYPKAAKGCGHPDVQCILDLISEYHIDGLVMHKAMSCRASTIGQLYFKNVLKDYVKIPTLFIEGDIVDERMYDAVRTNAMIDNFVETLEASKRTRG